jgi:hypothetical protein
MEEAIYESLNAAFALVLITLVIWTLAGPSPPWKK